MRYPSLAILFSALLASCSAEIPAAQAIPVATDAAAPGSFWQLIDVARAGGDDCDSRAGALTARLGQLSPMEIVQFDKEWQTRLAESYRWDLWGVAYLINGGASDDSFEYFRAWLILQGHTYFTAALANPERAADQAEAGEVECETVLSAAAEAYQAKTGEELPPSGVRFPTEPAGRPWEEEDLPGLFPAVARRFN